MTTADTNYENLRKNIEANRLWKQIKARNVLYLTGEQHKSSGATSSHTRNTSMQETHHRPCPRHHRHQSFLCREARGLRDVAREFQRNVDSYDDDDAVELHFCDYLLG